MLFPLDQCGEFVPLPNLVGQPGLHGRREQARQKLVLHFGTNVGSQTLASLMNDSGVAMSAGSTAGTAEQSIMEYGIRVFPDESGQPIVVVFSQAAMPTPAADSLEWQQGQVVERGVTTDHDMTPMFEGPAKLTARITEVIRTNATGFQQGGSVYRKLHVKHPDTGALTSVVFTWAPADADRARAMWSGRPADAGKAFDNAVGGRRGTDYPVTDW